MIRLFLFKLLFKFTWWIAPDKPRVNRLFDLYLEEIEKEEKLAECQKRQFYLDQHVRPRTQTYEYLSCTKQRAIYEPSMPTRFLEREQPRSHYSDYQEAQKYHDD